jgi:hypothetical protein
VPADDSMPITDPRRAATGSVSGSATRSTCLRAPSTSTSPTSATPPCPSSSGQSSSSHRCCQSSSATSSRYVARLLGCRPAPLANLTLLFAHSSVTRLQRRSCRARRVLRSGLALSRPVVVTGLPEAHERCGYRGVGWRAKARSDDRLHFRSTGRLVRLRKRDLTQQDGS